MPEQIDTLDPKNYIVIKNARVNNLKNLSVAIPRNKLVVITGVSGSGKSSLAFDTLFAEGQRMYVESLSSYARQFLSRMEKPEVDYIKGISPAIAIEQKVNTSNTRSTVGTTTEIYDYLKLLYARVGNTYSPISGKKVTKDSVTNVVDFVLNLDNNTKLIITAPLKVDVERGLKKELEILLQKGFTRIKIDEDVWFIEDILDENNIKISDLEKSLLHILIDRVVTNNDDESLTFRLGDSIQTAFYEGHGECDIEIVGDKKHSFSDRFEMDGIVFEEPSVNFFTFNNPYGACPTCEGFGHILGIDEDLVIPNKNLSVSEGGIAPWKSEKMQEWLIPLLQNAEKFNFPLDTPINKLTKEEYLLLWDGNEYFEGLNRFFKEVESQTYKIQYRVLLSRYRGRTFCPDCHGTRLRKDASYVKIDGKSISDLVLLPITELAQFLSEVKFSKHEEKIAKRIFDEIKHRVSYLERVGLGYLTLNRLSNTLSGGESQRINLATSLGSSLVGSMYILDEPSIGLHPRDANRLVGVLQSLRDLGNTVVVVEHDEETMQAADQIIDIGPEAGRHGGELVFQGSYSDVIENGETLTSKYLNHKLEIPVPSKRRKWKSSISILGARENNLKNVDVEIPLGVLSVITGVSGSGKSTLIKKILYPALSKILGEGFGEKTGNFDQLTGDINEIESVEYIDQNPIGKSSRSNPVTYVKAYDEIRTLFANQPLSKSNGYKASHFSFNVDGGRCDTCKGEGEITVEMQFMADLHLKCEECDGKRFKEEIREVKYKEKNIADILSLTIEEAIDFFNDKPKIVEKIKPLFDVGLGYIQLGQSSNTLSGGEAQRVKLASFLSKSSTNKNILFIFDEPSTGLHFHDINKLVDSFNALLEKGHSIIVIEHNLDIIKCADWILDLGPEGGDEGGYLNFAGIPEDIIKLEDNYTGKFLADKFKK